MTTKGMNPEEKLDDFLNGIQPGMAGMEAYVVPEGESLDFSRASLATVEDIVLGRFDVPDDLTHPGEKDFVETVTGYLGETLLRVTGGRWIWDDDPDSPAHDLPVLEPDQALGLNYGSPLHLMAVAVRERDGHQFEHAYDQWHEATERHRADNPSWTPVKERTPGLDPVAPDTSGYLESWLTERASTFDAWAARYGGGTTWDFSPGSLDALQALVVRTVPTADDLETPEHQEFSDGAAWYLGEVLLTAKGGEWRYQAGEREYGNPFLGYQYVEQPGKRGGTTTPILLLSLVLEDREPGFLRGFFAQFAE